MLEMLADLFIRPFFDVGAETAQGWVTDVQPDAAAGQVGGVSVGRYRRRVPVAWAALATILGGAALVALFNLTGTETRMAAVPGIAAVLAGWAAAETAVARLAWDNATLQVRSLRKGTRLLRWADLVAVDYAPLGGRRLHFGRHGAVSVGNLIDGSALIVRVAQARVRWNRRPAAVK